MKHRQIRQPRKVRALIRQVLASHINKWKQKIELKIDDFL